MGIAHACCMLRRSVFARAVGYDERFPSSQDFELFYRIRSWCRFAALDEPLVNYRADADGPTWKRYAESEFWARYAVHLAAAGSSALAPSAFRRRLASRVRHDVIDRARFLRVRIQSILGRVHELH